MRAILPTLALFLAVGLALPAAEGAAERGRPGQGKLFERIDADGDGQISRAEWDAGRERLRERRDERDSNDDHRVDADERRAAIEARLAKLKAAHPKLYARLDANGDGTVSLEEAKAFRDAHGGGRRGGEGQASTGGTDDATPRVRPQRPGRP